MTIRAYTLSIGTQNTMLPIVKIFLPLLCSRVCIIDIDIVIPVYMSANFFISKVGDTAGRNTVKSVIFNEPFDLR